MTTDFQCGIFQMIDVVGAAWNPFDASYTHGVADECSAQRSPAETVPNLMVLTAFAVVDYGYQLAFGELGRMNIANFVALGHESAGIEMLCIVVEPVGWEVFVLDRLEFGMWKQVGVAIAVVVGRYSAVDQVGWEASAFDQLGPGTRKQVDNANFDVAGHSFAGIVMLLHVEEQIGREVLHQLGFGTWKMMDIANFVVVGLYSAGIEIPFHVEEQLGWELPAFDLVIFYNDHPVVLVETYHGYHED